MNKNRNSFSFEKSNVKKKAIDRNESTLVSNITKTSEEKSLHQSEKLCSPKRQCNAALECSNASSSVGNLTVSSTNRVRRVNALENNQVSAYEITLPLILCKNMCRKRENAYVSN